jgi:hypothetical protein
MTKDRIGEDYQEHKDRVEAARHNFKTGDINEREFVLLLASLGFNATEIEAEIKEHGPENEIMG